MRHAYALFGVVLASVVLGFGPQAQAQQKITPNHVYQVTEEVLAELALLHRANFSKADVSAAAAEQQPRRPRHVIQQGLRALRQVQMLRFINGLEAKDIEAPEVREIRPADVIEVANRLKADIAELRAIFGVTEPAPASALPEGKTPTDVYQNMLRISMSVEQLGIPKTVPNDVFRLAEQLRADVDILARAQGVGGVGNVAVSKGKKPADVYGVAFDLLAELDVLTKSSGFGIPGGVVLPARNTGAITPGHVIEALGFAVAEVASIKAKLGVMKRTPKAMEAVGKSPSNVFDEVQRTRAIVAQLIAEQG